MKVTHNELTAAAKDCGVSQAVSDKLWLTLEQRARWRPRFDLVHVLYYAGALIVITAMSVFMTTAWSKVGPSALFTFAALYLIIFLMLAEWLKPRPGMSVPTGLLAIMAVIMVPLIIYALQDWFQLWPEGQTPWSYRGFHKWIKSFWLQIEIWTLVAGIVILYRYKYPFIIMPIAICLWCISMDIAPMIAGNYPESPDFATASKEAKAAYVASVQAINDVRKWVSVIFGAAMIALSYAIDHRTKLDYAFWIYVFGLLTFWGGLTSMDSDNELGKFIYALINVGIIGFGIFVSRRVFLILGGIGVYAYIGYLALKVFDHSLLFPMIMAAFGLGTIWLGITLYRHGKKWEGNIIGALPSWINGLRPQQRELPPIDPLT